VFFEDAKEKKPIYAELLKAKKDHTNLRFLEKETKPPNQFTEATLLRAMKTQENMDDEDLRELMKENGIDDLQHERNIIETL
jgi:DNA topoisomerase-3